MSEMALENRTLLVLKYLWENTDEEHTATIADLREFIVNSGLSKPDPRPIKKDIEQLCELGIDIVCNRSTQNRYFVASRNFDTAEVKLLIDAVQSSRSIARDKSRNLVKKLAVFVNPGQKNVLKRQLYMDERVKADNEHIMITVDKIFSAIAGKKRISFRYIEYTREKRKAYRHGGYIYEVSPYDMIWSSDLYYFTAFDEKEKKVKIFRADRVDTLEILNTPASKKPKGYKISEYHSRIFSMYKGPTYEVTLKCENALMNNIIDRFGEKVHTEILDDEHFLVRTEVSLSDVFYGWIFASEGKMRIIAPPSAVEGFNRLIESFR